MSSPLKIAAKSVSWILHPYLMTIYVVGILLFADTVFSYYALRVKLYLLWVITLYSIILPLLGTALMRRFSKLWERGSIWHTKAKVIPLLLGSCCFLLCVITLNKVPSLLLFRKIAMAALFCQFYSLALLPFCRMSLHLTAMGAVVAFFCVMNIIGVLSLFWTMLLVIILAGILASSRLYLGRNNISQVTMGFVGGFVASSLAMLYF